MGTVYEDCHGTWMKSLTSRTEVVYLCFLCYWEDFLFFFFSVRSTKDFGSLQLQEDLLRFSVLSLHPKLLSKNLLRGERT